MEFRMFINNAHGNWVNKQQKRHNIPKKTKKIVCLSVCPSACPPSRGYFAIQMMLMALWFRTQHDSLQYVSWSRPVACLSIPRHPQTAARPFVRSLSIPSTYSHSLTHSECVCKRFGTSYRKCAPTTDLMRDKTNNNNKAAAAASVAHQFRSQAPSQCF